jgi:hypothetical protein
MAKSVENHLGNRATPGERLEASLVVYRLGQTKQRSALLNLGTAYRKRPSSAERAAGKGQRGIDGLCLIANRLQLGRIRPACSAD